LVELAEVPGVPARTIRYYIARGLLPPPLVGGRSACYGEEHLKEPDRIKTLQGQGQTLAQVAWQLDEGQKGSAESLRLGLCGSSSNSRVATTLRCMSSPPLLHGFRQKVRP